MKRKVVMLMLSVAVAVSMVLVGCAPEAAPPAEEEEAPETPSGVSDQAITWKLQTMMPPGTAPYDSLVRLSDAITKASGGRLVFTPFAAGGVVAAYQEFDGIDSNAIQAGHLNFAILTSIFPSASIMAGRVGGMWPTQLYGWLTHGGGHEFQEALIEDFDVRLLKGCGIIEPPEIWCHSRVPINGLADTQGLKLRTFGDCGPILAAMGIATVFMPPGEVYEAMSRGVIDACEAGGAYNNWGMGWHEVADYLYLSAVRSPSLYTNFAVNAKAFDELPSDLQALVEEVSRQEAIVAYMDALVKDATYIQMFEDYGTEVGTIPIEVNDRLKAEAAKFYDAKAAEYPLIADLLQSQREFEKLWDGYVGRW